MLHAALLLDTGLERTLIGQGASLALVLEHAELVTGVGHGLQAQDLDGVGGAGLGDGVALGIEHGADAAVGKTGDQRIAHVQGTAGHQHGSDRTAALVELSLEDVTGGKGVGVGLELEHVGLEQHGLEQVVDTDLLLGRDVDEHVLSAPLLGMMPYSVSSWRTRSGLAPGLSILLTATTMGTPAALAWLIDSMV